MVVAVAIAATLAVPAAGATARQKVYVVDMSPFVVVGRGFGSAERVRVTLWLDRRRVRTVTATRAGSFTVRFPGTEPQACPAYTVVAVGNRGSRATVKVRGECVPIAPAA